jgi:nicotinamidase/pyrazinamidase
MAGTPARAALLIIDVQNDFCPGGALAVSGGDRVIDPLNRHIQDALGRGLPIYASRDWHPPVSTHFAPYGGEWPPHCVRDTPGAAFHPALRLPPSTIVVSKGEEPDRAGYSAFEGRTADGRALADDLRARRVEHLYVGGLATDYCVKASVLDALKAGFSVDVLEDSVAGVDVRPGDAARALAAMREAGAIQGSGIRDRESGIRDQGSGIRDQGSGA